jgi:hypothetical protein
MTAHGLVIEDGATDDVFHFPAPGFIKHVLTLHPLMRRDCIIIRFFVISTPHSAGEKSRIQTTSITSDSSSR